MQSKFPITGTFIDEISYDIPSSNWSYEDWSRELDYMKGVGIDTLVFIRGGFENKMTFPSKCFPNYMDHDFAGFIFKEAHKRDMNVFMGLYISNIDWNGGDVKGEIRKNKMFVDEVIERYGDIPSFKGWYLPHEACRNEFNIAEVMGGLSKLCKDKAPDKKVLISPFFPSAVTSPRCPLSPERFRDDWENLFSICGKEIDICAFQDGSAPIYQMEEYLKYSKELCDKYNIAHWVNTETFERDPRCVYYPITFDLLKKKLDIIENLAEKTITFEFSHFLSPQSIYPSAHNLYKRYVEYYGNK